MEAMREAHFEATRVMRWEGIAFELQEPEIRIERARAGQREQKPRVTTKQKKLLEAERFTHTLP